MLLQSFFHSLQFEPWNFLRNLLFLNVGLYIFLGFWSVIFYLMIFHMLNFLLWDGDLLLLLEYFFFLKNSIFSSMIQDNIIIFFFFRIKMIQILFILIFIKLIILACFYSLRRIFNDILILVFLLRLSNSYLFVLMPLLMWYFLYHITLFFFVMPFIFFFQLNNVKNCFSIFFSNFLDVATFSRLGGQFSFRTINIVYCFIFCFFLWFFLKLLIIYIPLYWYVWFLFLIFLWLPLL